MTMPPRSPGPADWKGPASVEAGAGAAAGPAGDVGRCAQLEAQVHLLQTNNQGMQEQLAGAQDQLHAALQRLQQLEPADHNLVDARYSLATIKDVNMELQHELNENRRLLDVARDQSSIAEVRRAEQDSQLSETRQRLFTEQRNSAQLQDELQKRVAAHASMHDRLHEEMSLHETTRR